MKPRTIAVWTTLVLALLAVNWLTFGRERLAANGQVMFLALAPVDPRSLMQGDYMNLRYALAAAAVRDDQNAEGALVVRLDEQQVASFARVHKPGSALAPGEHLLRYRVRSGAVRIGAESFFFQEGEAALYQEARYAELRVADDGDALLVGLRGAALERLGNK